MKHTKRLLCILLGLVLCTALLVPSAAASNDPNAPVITQQPVKIESVHLNETLELSVQAYAENGGTLSYAWYDIDWTPDSKEKPIATGATMRLPITKGLIQDYFRVGYIVSAEFCVVVTNTYVDENGSTKTASVKSDPVDIIIVNSLGRGMLDFLSFPVQTMGSKFKSWVINIIMFPFLLIMAPFYLVLYPVLGYTLEL